MKSLSRVQLFATPWTVAHQAPPSMEFSRQEYWSGLPFPSPGDLPDPGTEPRSPALQADALPSEPPGTHLVLTGAMDLKLSAAAQTSHALNGHIFKTPAFPEKLPLKPSVGERPAVFCLLVFFKFSIHHPIPLKSSVKKGTSADIENGLWTLWEKEREEWIGRVALKRTHYHM